ncbi:MAG TPA: hypothetical protein VNH11_19195 [Pirellulales bacterium]|nr:hypothetical protein [Pirellulales bacterium]
MPDADLRCREALLLWLRWHAEQQQITESLYRHRHRPAQMESLLDRLDALRDEAVALSQEALHGSTASIHAPCHA